MRRRKLLSLIDVKRVEEAIGLAERQTTGEIRVSVAGFFWGNVHAAAERAFVRLGMQKTEHRNGVLIFVVPARRQFTVLGDAGIHHKVGQDFWESISKAMSKEFQAGRFTEGLLHGIAEAGKQLAVHFPALPGEDRNELPNEVDV
jgi:uncharacterized membrane protein